MLPLIITILFLSLFIIVIFIFVIKHAINANEFTNLHPQIYLTEKEKLNESGEVLSTKHQAILLIAKEKEQDDAIKKCTEANICYICGKQLIDTRQFLGDHLLCCPEGHFRHIVYRGDVYA